MKTCLGLMLTVWLASMFAASETGTLGTNEFSITGEFTSESVSNLDATVLVSQEVLTETVVIEAVEIASGEFVDGEARLSGTIDGPTLVTITVTFEDYDSISIAGVIAPDDDLLFRVIQADDGTPNQLMFVGNVRLNENEANKFTVWGDLSSLQAELQRTTDKVTGYRDGKVGTINYGSVQVAENGTFKIEKRNR